MQFKSRDEIIPEAMRLIAQNPDAHVMIIVDSDAGPEILQTHLSRIWSFGVLAAAEQMLDAELRGLRDAVSRKKRATQAALESTTKTNPTQAN